MYYPLMDITDRIPEPPKWWLEGIPRYCEYDPDEFTYYETNFLVRIGCQYCRRAFDVAVYIKAIAAIGILDPVSGYPMDEAAGRFMTNLFDDPPFHLGEDNFNCVGNSMLADWIAILQAWEGHGPKRRRRSDLEGPSPNSPI